MLIGAKSRWEDKILNNKSEIPAPAGRQAKQILNPKFIISKLFGA